MARQLQGIGRHRSRRAFAALGLALSLGLAAGSGHAQSLSESRIVLNRSEAVQITNVDDWVIGVFGPDVDINNIAYRWDGTCVHSTTGAFRVEVSLANGGTGPLVLRNGGGAEMAYEIYTFSASATGGGFGLTRFTNGPVVQTNRRGSTAQDCNGTPNMWFTALVRPGPFNAAPAGVYRDYATIIVTPE